MSLLGRDQVLTSVLTMAHVVGLVGDVQAAKVAALEREALGSTFVGNGTVLPHVVGASALKDAVMAIECHPVDWDAHTVSLLVMVIIPDETAAGSEALADVISTVARTLSKNQLQGAIDLIFDLFTQWGAIPVAGATLSGPLRRCTYLELTPSRN